MNLNNAIRIFRRQPLAEKLFIVLFVVVLVLHGGSKNNRSSSSSNNGAGIHRQTVRDSRDCRQRGNSCETSGFRISDFQVDKSDMALTFALSWNNNSFDRTSSSAVDLFLTSNLLCRSWIPLGRFVLPVRTNEFEISVNTDNVSADAMSSFINSFHVGTAFFRFGLDVDSDGDSLTDAFESWTLGTSPFNSDTDLDGIDDNVEIRCSMDPLNPDSDGDGYSDGEEMLRGQNPLSYDSGSSITIRYYYDDDDRLTQTHAGANEASTEIKITPAGNFYVISDR